jgi:lipoprotein-anchoring transpeptidase ErfK/SrfK
MKLSPLFLARLCAFALLFWTPWVGVMAQDSEPITRVVPVGAATPTPAEPEAPPDPGLPPIGSGPDASPSPADTTPAPAPAMEPATPAPEESMPAPEPEANNPAPVPEQTPGPEARETPPEPTPPPSPYSIEIDLNKQRAYLLEDGNIIAQSPISSGRPGHLTPTGNFAVIQKDLNHFSTLYGAFVDITTGRVVKAGADTAMPTPKGCKFVPAPMKWFMRFDGASGMHAGILPGYAASHGCVRMPPSKAELFYNTVEVGTPVHVFGVAPPPEFREMRQPLRLMATSHAAATPRKHWWLW